MAFVLYSGTKDVSVLRAVECNVVAYVAVRRLTTASEQNDTMVQEG